MNTIETLRRFLSILAYGFLRGTFLSLLCWALVMSILYSGAAFLSNLPHLDASALGRILFFVAYGVFAGLVIGIKLSLWTGIIIGLAAAVVSASFAFPLKNSVLYKRLMQIICMGVAMLGTFLVARDQFSDDAKYSIMTMLIAAVVAFLVSRRLASWAISRSPAI